MALLAARSNEIVPLDALVDAVWAGSPTRTARNAIQVQIHGLRDLLDAGGGASGERIVPAIVTDGGGYRLVVDASTLDAIGFTEGVATARREFDAGRPDAAETSIRQALDVWGGEPFGGLADELGLDDVAARWWEVRRSADELLSELLLLRADLDTARLRHLVDAEPYREVRWRHLMTALYRTGRQVEALRTYQRAAELFADVGVEPGSELRRLEERILRQDPHLLQGAASTGGPRRRPIPIRPVGLIGRDLDVERLAVVVADTRVVTLVGLGGIGKTSLAIEAARTVSSAFRDGAVVVELSSLVEGATADDVAALVVAATGADRGSSGARTVDEVARHLDDSELLVVLDNAEHVAAGARQFVDRVIGRCAGVHLMVTSRTPIGAGGEHLWDVGALDARDAAALFESTLRRVRPRSADGADSALIDEICAGAGGVPLLLELTAAQARSRPLSELAQSLRETSQHTDLAEDRLVWSFGRLGDEQRRAATALAVFRGGAHVDDVAPVLASVGAAVIELSAVVDASLAGFDPATARFTMLEPVREALVERMPEVAEVAAAAHVDHFTGSARRELPTMGSTTDRSGIAWFEREEANIRAALERAVRLRDDGAHSAIAAMGVYLWRSLRPAEAFEWFERLEREFEPLAAHDPTSATYSAHLAMWAGRPDLAEQRFHVTRRHVAPDDELALGRIDHGLGNVAGWGRGRAAASLAWYRSAHERLAAIEHPLAVVSTVSEGYMAVRSGAWERVDEVLSLLGSETDVRALGGAVGPDMVAGMRAMYDGDHDLADVLLASALAGLDRLGAAVLKGPGLAPFVWNAVFRGDFATARERAEIAFAFSSEHSGGWRIGDACVGYGMAELGLGHVDAAGAWFGRALRAGLRAPEIDIVAWAAAGLVEVGAWLSDDRRRHAACTIRRALADERLAIPAGVESVFPFMMSVDERAGAATAADIVRSVREVLHDEPTA